MSLSRIPGLFKGKDVPSQYSILNLVATYNDKNKKIFPLEEPQQYFRIFSYPHKNPIPNDIISDYKHRKDEDAATGSKHHTATENVKGSKSVKIRSGRKGKVCWKEVKRRG